MIFASHRRTRARFFSLITLLTVPLSSCWFGKKEEQITSAVNSCSSAALIEAARSGEVLLPEEQAARLLQQALVLSDQYNSQVSDAERVVSLNKITQLIQTRSDLLASRITAHPEEILRSEIAPELRARVALAGRACLEIRRYRSGQIQVLSIDETLNDGQIQYQLTDDQGIRFALYFGEKHPGLHTGSNVQVNTLELPCANVNSHALAVGGHADDIIELSTHAGIASRTFGAQSTLAILLSFQDKPATSSLADVQQVVFSQVSAYLNEASSTQTWLTGQAVGPYTLPMTSATCDVWTLKDQAQAAARSAGFDLSQYTHFIYVFPRNACSWLGLGTIGGNPSDAWINSSLTLHTVAHEFGHNLGLYHSNALNCGTAASIGNTCSSIEYGDTTDIMGNRVPGHYNAYQKERLGWLNYGLSPTITTVDQSGTFTLSPYETTDMNAKALKILKTINTSNGSSDYYYLEYRQPQGFDTIFSQLLSPNNLTNGLVVHTGNSSDFNTSYLLQMNPQLGNWFEAALNPGQAFMDNSTLTRISLLSADLSGASVQVDLGNGTPGCSRGTPTLVLSPTRSDWTSAGTKVIYTATVRNGDSESCDPSDFDLNVTAPFGWTSTTLTKHFTLTPQNSGNTAIEMTSPTDVLPGSYELKAQAWRSDSSQDSSDPARSFYFVMSQTDAVVALSTDRSVYHAGDHIDLHIDAASQGSVAAGADYTLILTQPDGSSVRRTGRTDSNGSAIHTFEVSRCAPTGTYWADVTLKSGGAQANRTLSFDVH